MTDKRTKEFTTELLGFVYKVRWADKVFKIIGDHLQDAEAVEYGPKVQTIGFKISKLRLSQYKYGGLGDVLNYVTTKIIHPLQLNIVKNHFQGKSSTPATRQAAWKMFKAKFEDEKSMFGGFGNWKVLIERADNALSGFEMLKAFVTNNKTLIKEKCINIANKTDFSMYCSELLEPRLPPRISPSPPPPVTEATPPPLVYMIKIDEKWTSGNCSDIENPQKIVTLLSKNKLLGDFQWRTLYVIGTDSEKYDTVSEPGKQLTNDLGKDPITLNAHDLEKLKGWLGKCLSKLAKCNVYAADLDLEHIVKLQFFDNSFAYKFTGLDQFRSINLKPDNKNDKGVTGPQKRKSYNDGQVGKLHPKKVFRQTNTSVETQKSVGASPMRCDYVWLKKCTFEDLGSENPTLLSPFMMCVTNFITSILAAKANYLCAAAPPSSDDERMSALLDATYTAQQQMIRSINPLVVERAGKILIKCAQGIPWSEDDYKIWVDMWRLRTNAQSELSVRPATKEGDGNKCLWVVVTAY